MLLLFRYHCCNSQNVLPILSIKLSCCLLSIIRLQGAQGKKVHSFLILAALDKNIFESLATYLFFVYLFLTKLMPCFISL